MAASDLLRFRDVRSAYRLIGDCRDLAGDPAAWHGRTLEGPCRLVETPAGAVGGLSEPAPSASPKPFPRLMPASAMAASRSTAPFIARSHQSDPVNR